MIKTTTSDSAAGNHFKLSTMQRGGFPFKTVILALFIVGSVYLLYLYNTTLGRLRDAELGAERYRREEEAKGAQLQDVLRLKDELQEKCDNEKREYTNRLNSLNQQHKMLKSQYDEHQGDQMRLEQEAKRVREEFNQVEAQRTQEYTQLKQQHQLELSTLKDQIANAQRQNQQLQTEVSSLKAQVQTGQQELKNKEGQLAQARQQFAGLVQQQQQQAQQGLNNNNANAQASNSRLQFQNHFDQGGGAGAGGGGLNPNAAGLVNMNIGNADPVRPALAVQQPGGLNLGQLQQQLQQQQQQQAQQQQNPEQQQQLLDAHNEQHQVLPPHPDDRDPQHDANAGARLQGQGHGSEDKVKDEDHQVGRPPDFNRNRAGDVDRHADPLALQPQDEHRQILPPQHGDALGGNAGEEDQLNHHMPLGQKKADRNNAEEKDDADEHYEDRYDEDMANNMNDDNVNVEDVNHPPLNHLQDNNEANEDQFPNNVPNNLNDDNENLDHNPNDNNLPGNQMNGADNYP